MDENQLLRAGILISGSQCRQAGECVFLLSTCNLRKHLSQNLPTEKHLLVKPDAVQCKVMLSRLVACQFNTPHQTPWRRTCSPMHIPIKLQLQPSRPEICCFPSEPGPEFTSLLAVKCFPSVTTAPQSFSFFERQAQLNCVLEGDF